MQFLSNTKVRYKLFLICMLPFFIQLYFVGTLLYRDYQIMQRMQFDRMLTDSIELSGNLVDALSNEMELNMVKALQLPLFKPEEQIRLQEATDESFKEWKDKVAYLSSMREGMNSRVTPLINKFSGIERLRKLVDDNAITTAKIESYYLSVERELIEYLASMIKEIEEVSLIRQNYIVLNLILQQLAGARESLLGLDFINNPEPSLLFQISEFIGQQQAYISKIFTLSDSNEDDLYRKTLQSASVREVEKLRDQLRLGKQIAIDAWWNAQSEKKITLHALQDKVIAAIYPTIEANYSSHVKEFYLILFLIIIAIPLSFYLVILSLRSVSKKLREEIEVISRAGNDIMSSIAEVSAGASETATSVNETTTTVEELKQTAQVASEKAAKVSSVSEDALQTIIEGEKSLEETIMGMQNIQRGMNTISESIVKLSAHSQSIGEIIDTVNELAEQSHLLAVNAAIEAAKAGEQGKGFSVVAQEVRSLAEQSKQATVQVRNLLNDIQNATSKAVMATEQGSKAVQEGMHRSDKVNSSIESLAESIKKVSDASSQIALSSEQQLIGVNQVNIAMNNIQEATEKHVEHMRQIEQSIEGMNTVGESLKDLVANF